MALFLRCFAADMGENHFAASKSASVPVVRETPRQSVFTSPSPQGVAPDEDPPLSVRALADRIGMSPTFIRTEIHSGHLKAVAIGRGRKRVFRIADSEARRYAKSLGL